MTKYIIPIEAWVSVEAEDSEKAWSMAIVRLSDAITKALRELGDNDISFGEPELDTRGVED